MKRLHLWLSTLHYRATAWLWKRRQRNNTEGNFQMKCPECVKLGMKSVLHASGGITTLMCGQYFYDEDGVYHSHDPNLTTTEWHCSQGHQGYKREKKACPAPNCIKGSIEFIARKDNDQRCADTPVLYVDRGRFGCLPGTNEPGTNYQRDYDNARRSK